MEKNIKEKKAAKAVLKHQEDVKSYRLMIEFLLAIVALFLAITAGKHSIYVALNVAPVLLMVSGVLFGLSALYFCIMRIKRVDESNRIITSAGIFGNATALFLLCAALHLFVSAQFVVCAIIALTVAYIVYNVVGGAFFGYSALTAAAYITLQIASMESSFLPPVSYAEISNLLIGASKVLVFVVPVAMMVVAVLSVVLKNGVSILGISFTKKRIAVAMLITAIIALAGALCTVLYPIGVSIAIYALIAFYFIVTVIGIFKMM